MHLSQAQHGAYFLLLLALWKGGGAIPDRDDVLAMITKSTPQEWKKLRPVLEHFCTIVDGEWKQKRLTRVWEKAKEKYATKVTNGRRGGRPKRAHGLEGAQLRNATATDAMPTGSGPESERLLQQHPQPQGKALGVLQGHGAPGSRRASAGAVAGEGAEAGAAEHPGGAVLSGDRETHNDQRRAGDAHLGSQL
jgi:uncharacterized protein YdaU (DUF1376 family)